MSDTDVLKEFLVSIGFQIDEAKYKKTKETLKGVEGAITGLAAAVGTVVAAVKVGVVNVSDDLESLYFASQRIGSSVKEIKAAGFAIGQMGGDAKAGLQSIENLAEAIRSNPSMEGLLNGLGVQTRTSAGELRGRVEIFRDLAKQLQAMDYRVAKQRAALLGIDANTLQAIRRGDLEKFMAQYRDMTKGQDMDAQAKGAHEFMNNVRELGAQFDRLFSLVASRWSPFIGLLSKGIAAVVNFLIRVDKATDGWSTRLGSLAVVIAGAIAAFGVLGGGLAGVGAAFAAVAAALATPAALIVALVAAVGIAAYELIKNWDGVAGFFEGVWKRIADAFEEGVKRARKAIDDLRAGDVGKALKDLRTAANPEQPPPVNDNGPALEHHPGRKVLDERVPQWVRSDQDKDTKALEAERSKLQKKVETNDFWGTDAAKARTREHAQKRIGDIDRELQFRNVRPGAVQPVRPRAAVQPETAAPSPATNPQRQQQSQTAVGEVGARIGQAIAYFRSKGWTRAQATGIVANLLGENDTLDPHRREVLAGGKAGPGYGIAQWTDKARKDRFRQLFGHDLTQSTFAEQLAYFQRELETTERGAGAKIRAAANAAQAAIAAVAAERPADAAGAMRQRADIARQLEAGTYPAARGAAVSFTQQTTITVQGGSDAQATGRAVGREQNRVNGDLVRSLRGSVG